MKYWRFISKLITTNLKASVALRGAFLMQLVFMMINNLIFFVVWWILFQKFEDINGWTIRDVKTMYGFAAGSWGLAVVFGTGARYLADKVISGELDSYLVQPKNILIHITGSKSSPSGWGDVISAIVLFAWAGHGIENIPLIFTLLVCGAFIFLAIIIIANSLSFWLGNLEGFHHQLYEFLILFSTYPEGLFGGWIKMLLFSVVPAGFVSYLPVAIMREFSWISLGICLGSAIFYLSLAWWIFTRGLRRYESGNLMGSGS